MNNLQSRHYKVRSNLYTIHDRYVFDLLDRVLRASQ